MARRLYSRTLWAEYQALGKQTGRKLLNMKALLQDDYGERLDCTLTCMACIWGEENYAEIESIAKRYGYNGEKRGTNPLVVQRIMQVFMKAHKLPGRPCSAYGKCIGWNYATIKRLIDGGTPVILNLWTDGRNYYKDHSVTIVGYETYENGQFLLVYDNWSRGVSMIDYKKLSVVSSINFVTTTEYKGDICKTQI